MEDAAVPIPEEPSQPGCKPEVVTDHPVLSLADADICLLSRPNAENERTRFMVHRHILLAYSTVFRDMFETASGSTTVSDNGIPGVALDDSAFALQDLLFFMYPHHHQADTPMSMPTFHNRTAKACLQLLEIADKYHVSNLRYMLEASLIDQMNREHETYIQSGVYMGSLTLHECIQCLAYGHRVGNERIQSLALTASKSAEEVNDDISFSDVSPALLALDPELLIAFWKYQYDARLDDIKFQQEASRTQFKAFWQLKEWYALCLKQPHQLVAHKGMDCWQRTALPVWYGIIVEVLGETMTPQHGQVVKIAAAQEEADFGECGKCITAIGARLREIKEYQARL